MRPVDHPSELSPKQRYNAIVAIFALAFLRLRQSRALTIEKDSQSEQKREESFVDGLEDF